MSLSASPDYLSVFKPTTRATWDVLTPIALIIVSLFGVAFIYSAQFSVPHSSTGGLLALIRLEWFKQLVYLAAGAVLYIAVSLIDYRFWLSVAHWVYAVCLIPLVVVFIPGVSGGSAER